jgi:copper chaperone
MDTNEGEKGFMTKTTLDVRGMTCNHCVHAVLTALEELPGVRSALVELDRGRAVVEYDESQASPREMTTAVAESGYQAEEAG